MHQAAAILATLALTTLSARADDWPQWQGPLRNNISQEQGLAKTWPAAGPKLLWTYRDAGVGYSSPSIVGGTLYSVGAEEGGEKEAEFVFALNVSDGKVKWKKKFGTPYGVSGSDVKWGGGPRGTPSVVDGKVFAEGARGDVVCLDAEKGDVIWQKSLPGDLGGRMMSGWGNSESVLVDGKAVICTPGGPKGTLAALNGTDGKVIWQSKEVTDDAAYSSPIVAEFGGIRQYIQQTSKGVIGVSATDGKLLWQFDCPAYRTAVIPTPIYRDGLVYVTAGYGAGCSLIELKKVGNGIKAEQRYRGNKTMTNHHGGVVLIDDCVYGFSDGGGWTCQDLESGKEKWADKKGINQGGLDKGSLTCVGDDLFLFGEGSGNLVRIKATPDGWKDLGRFKIPEETKLRRPSGKFWTHPVVSNGKLYLRDQDLLFCFDVSGQ